MPTTTLELEALKAAAVRRLTAGQGPLDLDLGLDAAPDAVASASPLDIVLCVSVVFAALAVARLIEDRTRWSIARFVRTARRYRTVDIRAGSHVLTVQDPLPPDLRNALALTT